MTTSFDPGMRQKVARVSMTFHYPDGSAAVVTGEEVLIDVEFDYSGLMVDVQALENLSFCRTPDIRMRIRPEFRLNSCGALQVTKHPPISSA